MKLTDEQMRQFEDEGWLFLPDCFSPEEVNVLCDEGERIFAKEREEVWREADGVARMAFAAHLYSEAFSIVGRHPQLIGPVEQLFGERIYMHQYRVNAKGKFSGDAWQWHQDFGTWMREDGMPSPRAINVSIFLDEVFPFNGPLMLIPRSHKHGVFEAEQGHSSVNYPLWLLNKETVERLIREGGLVAPTGKAGGVLMFHGNLVHGASGNITPFPRKIVNLTLNAISNHIRRPTRPDWIAHRDFTPIVPCANDALLEYARRHSHAAA